MGQDNPGHRRGIRGWKAVLWKGMWGSVMNECLRPLMHVLDAGSFCNRREELIHGFNRYRLEAFLSHFFHHPIITLCLLSSGDHVGVGTETLSNTRTQNALASSPFNRIQSPPVKQTHQKYWLTAF